MGIQINGQTDTVTSTTAGGSVTVTPLAASSGLNVGTGASVSSPATNVLTLGTNNSERVRIDSSGNLGIGTNSPGRLLNLYAATTPIVRLTHTTASSYAGLEVYEGTTQKAAFNALGSTSSAIGGANAIQVWNFMDAPTVFGTNNTERVRVSAAGSFAVGTTAAISNLVTTGAPSTIWRPQLAFQNTTGSQAEAFVGSGSNAHNIWVTAGAEPSNDPDVSNWATARSTVAAIYRQRDASHRWFTDTSLTSGNTYTPTERARIDSSGRLLIGTTSGRTVGAVAGSIQIEGVTDTGLSVTNNSNGSAGDNTWLTLARTRGTAVGGTTAVSNNDWLGSLDFAGHNGSSFNVAARIIGQVDGTVSGGGVGDMPGRIVFATTADGASSPTARLTIFRDGTSEIAGNFRPTADNSYNLGGVGQRWATVYAANGTINTSDGREKTDIKDSPLGADFIKSLRPVSYKWIEGGKRELPERDEHGNIVYETLPGQRTHWGFIAQEVKEVVDETGVDFGGWILTDKNNPDSQQGLRYHEFIAPLTKALQEALEKIETLEAKVAALESA